MPYVPMVAHDFIRHVDFANPVSWAALTALWPTSINTITNLLKIAHDRPRLRLEPLTRPH